MQETKKTWVRSLSWENPLEEAVATHSSILAWRIPWTQEAGGLQSMGSQRVDMTEVTEQVHWDPAHSLNCQHHHPWIQPDPVLWLFWNFEEERRMQNCHNLDPYHIPLTIVLTIRPLPTPQGRGHSSRGARLPCSLLAWQRNKATFFLLGRTDAEAEVPILWPPDVKNWLIRKDPDAGKDWKLEKGMTEDEMVGWYHQLKG